MIIYVLDPPSTMAYIIYTDMMLTWMSQGESVFWLFIQESDPWLHPIFHSHVSYSEKSPEDMYHVVPLYTFIKLSLLCCSILDGSLSIYIYVHIYIYTCPLLPNDFPYIYIQDTDVIWTFTITLMKNIFTELVVLYGNIFIILIYYINILWTLYQHLKNHYIIYYIDIIM